MSGDSKIGLQAIGGIVRAGAARKIAGEANAAVRAPVRASAQDPLPAARLITMAGELADRGPTVDVSRVATLRTAIANGSYAPDSTVIAKAMLRFQQGGAA
ncbi:negative regulator of flagellin synthesis FlgM [Sphingopyxis panaciterrae]|uniref:flagellar biosynthesis anti-sigma factor FlgM n=1 Tax=Sphingopyxis panaciterrae TaxID=363841 RepID=UPI00141F94F3|nr:flagellar biosynthesis anti-sigma factor FlgM [Sphingopyxis panaciterrae]NIJ39663.1 negative regulator of flagellin synthesis FlgM [Sphingopyxis panaciterrae]